MLTLRRDGTASKRLSPRTLTIDPLTAAVNFAEVDAMTTTPHREHCDVTPESVKQHLLRSSFDGFEQELATAKDLADHGWYEVADKILQKVITGLSKTWHPRTLDRQAAELGAWMDWKIQHFGLSYHKFKNITRDFRDTTVVEADALSQLAYALVMVHSHPEKARVLSEAVVSLPQTPVTEYVCFRLGTGSIDHFTDANPDQAAVLRAHKGEGIPEVSTATYRRALAVVNWLAPK